MQVHFMKTYFDNDDDPSTYFIDEDFITQNFEIYSTLNC